MPLRFYRSLGRPRMSAAVEKRIQARLLAGMGIIKVAREVYWIDRKNGFGGFWATQILPFGDPVSFGGYLDFETAAYAGTLAPRSRAQLPKPTALYMTSASVSYE